MTVGPLLPGPMGLMVPGVRKAAGAGVSAYEAQVLSRPSLVSFWPFTEAAGTTAFDSGPGDNDGTYTGGVTLGQSGKGGLTSALFDGTSGYILSPADASLSISPPFTWEAWLYPTSVAASPKVIIATAAVSHHRWMLAGNGGGLMQLTNGGNFLSSATLTLNAWNYAAVTVTGTSWTFYKDGVAGGTGTGAFTPDAQLYIGQQGNGTNFFVGKQQFVAVYNTNLSAGEIAANYAAMP